MAFKILLIEDDEAFRKTLAKTLGMNGYEVIGAAAGKPGVEQARREQPDLVILDLALPGMHGLEVCQKLKEDVVTAGIPILILTGSDQDGLDIVCLDFGADDYMAKPPKTERLLAHCRVLLRRSGRRSEGGKLTLGSLELDYRRKSVILDGKDYPHLTPREFGILYELALHSPMPQDRESLYLKLWGMTPPSKISLRTIDVHVRRIRLKLGWRSDSWLTGIHGRGYSLVPPAARSRSSSGGLKSPGL
mgnify:FL=1